MTRCPICRISVSKLRRKKCPDGFCQDAIGCAVCFTRYYTIDVHKDCARLKAQSSIEGVPRD